jgi:hypothetical protein
VHLRPVGDCGRQVALALTVHEHVDVLAQSWPGLEQPIAHPGPAFIELGHQIAQGRRCQIQLARWRIREKRHE